MSEKRTQEEKFERLKDERFPWVERRRKAVQLAEIYAHAGYDEFAARAGTCATSLQFDVWLNGERRLKAANFCQLRLCPMCTARRAHRAAYKLSQVMDTVEREQGCRYIFLTLTVQNCTGADLGAALGHLTKSWYRLMDQTAIERAFGGWYRAIEITRNAKDGTYHPHIHAICAVLPEYFAPGSPLYITQKGWRERWQQAARLDYDPSVRVQVAKGKNGETAGRAAVLEAAKYATKDTEYIDPHLSLDQAAAIVVDYTKALHRRRLTAFGGWLKEAARRLDAERLEDNADLVHLEDEQIREDLADMIETYNWHMGAGDYVLARRELNPLKVVRIDESTGEVI